MINQNLEKGSLTSQNKQQSKYRKIHIRKSFVFQKIVNHQKILGSFQKILAFFPKIFLSDDFFIKIQSGNFVGCNSSAKLPINLFIPR